MFFSGQKTQLRVGNLALCTCYSFRIKLESDNEWIYFKAATEVEGPYCSVMHMSRAVKLGKTPMVRKIAHTRPHLLEAENKENKTPLVQAIEVGDVQMLQLLIALGSSVNRALLYNKRTPLMIAVYEGQLQIASILIDKGANVDAVDINGLNILHYAVDTDRIESVKFCLSIMKDSNCKDNNGWTALIRAAILNSSEKIISLLLDNGADKEIKDRYGLDFDIHRKISVGSKNAK
ncbi:hypothetical protein JTB14_027461 [Gonioctena quinquepunctata]|nr:hypothetical protein JTB14_027461 [Gonioctena quinquepunctata]